MINFKYGLVWNSCSPDFLVNFCLDWLYNSLSIYRFFLNFPAILSDFIALINVIRIFYKILFHWPRVAMTIKASDGYKLLSFLLLLPGRILVLMRRWGWAIILVFDREGRRVLQRSFDIVLGYIWSDIVKDRTDDWWPERWRV